MQDDRSGNALTESAIDREIERALAVEPSPEFVARVRARIASEPPPVAWRVPWIFTAVGATVGAILVVVAVSRSTQKPGPAVASPQPPPGKSIGDVSLTPLPARGPQGASGEAAPPVRGSKAVSGPNGAARSRSAARPAKPGVSLPVDNAASDSARRTDGASTPLGGPLRVGRDVRAPLKIVDVKPLYPDGARAAQVKGVVILEVTIAADGSVSSARVLRSIPIFDQAAIDAVRQWKFEPTLLNGMPVEVEMAVTINFVPASE
jgi:TonB family protein